VAMSRRWVTAAVKTQCTVEIGMHLCDLLVRRYCIDRCLHPKGGIVYKGVMQAVSLEYVRYGSSRCSA
jgi:hypothetical protein